MENLNDFIQRMSYVIAESGSAPSYDDVMVFQRDHAVNFDVDDDSDDEEDDQFSLDDFDDFDDDDGGEGNGDEGGEKKSDNSGFSRQDYDSLSDAEKRAIFLAVKPDPSYEDIEVLGNLENPDGVKMQKDAYDELSQKEKDELHDTVKHEASIIISKKNADDVADQYRRKQSANDYKNSKTADVRMIYAKGPDGKLIYKDGKPIPIGVGKVGKKTEIGRVGEPGKNLYLFYDEQVHPYIDVRKTGEKDEKEVKIKTGEELDGQYEEVESTYKKLIEKYNELKDKIRNKDTQWNTRRLFIWVKDKIKLYRKNIEILNKIKNGDEEAIRKNRQIWVLSNYDLFDAAYDKDNSYEQSERGVKGESYEELIKKMKERMEMMVKDHGLTPEKFKLVGTPPDEAKELFDGLELNGKRVAKVNPETPYPMPNELMEEDSNCFGCVYYAFSGNEETIQRRKGRNGVFDKDYTENYFVAMATYIIYRSNVEISRNPFQNLFAKVFGDRTEKET